MNDGMSWVVMSYIIFAVLVLLGVNIMIRRSRRQPSSHDDSEEREDDSPVADDELKDMVAAVNHERGSSGDEDPSSSSSTSDRTIAEKVGKRKNYHQKSANSSKSSRVKKQKADKANEDVPDDPYSMRKGPMLTAMLLGAFAAILNQTLLNIAIPKIMLDFGVSASTAQWLTTAYMLVNGVLIPITAFLMQTFSTRKMFLTAMTLFGIGTLTCALAPGFGFLLGGRVIQAAGTGMLMPLLTNVFLTLFPPEKRGAAMGTLGVVLMFAPAIGPTLSGWIVQNYSWRVLFYIVLPFVIFDIIVAYFLLRNVTKLTYPKIDVWGIILSTIGFGALLYGFSEAGNNSWTDPLVVVALVVGAVGLILFIWRELTTDTPMLEFRVFKYNMFALTTAVRSIAMIAMFAGMLLIPIYMQTIRGFTPLESGLLLLPGALIMGICQPIAGVLFDKIGARPLAIAGLLMTVWSTWEFHNLTMSTSFGWIMFLYAFRMVGMAGIMMPVMTAGLNQLPQRLNPHGTAMANTMRGVASSIGTAFLVSIFQIAQRHIWQR